MGFTTVSGFNHGTNNFGNHNTTTNTRDSHNLQVHTTTKNQLIVQQDGTTPPNATIIAINHIHIEHCYHGYRAGPQAPFEHYNRDNRGGDYENHGAELEGPGKQFQDMMTSLKTQFTQQDTHVTPILSASRSQLSIETSSSHRSGAHAAHDDGDDGDIEPRGNPALDLAPTRVAGGQSDSLLRLCRRPEIGASTESADYGLRRPRQSKVQQITGESMRGAYEILRSIRKGVVIPQDNDGLDQDDLLPELVPELDNVTSPARSNTFRKITASKEASGPPQLERGGCEVNGEDPSSAHVEDRDHEGMTSCQPEELIYDHRAFQLGVRGVFDASLARGDDEQPDWNEVV
ncbi:hypothetical protein SISNIDRAFT_488712 [Sistotremastrum niveocremeum HHB9708]|uniref:Uncharacterized protein n=1 Tax=Sistotremastrum niveocremeum HHB9708 TaxID=1314777 RepID=A0A164R281_9AGAM|nr:hypothetical protein SISNIDRAFT_488712 [Sistotremastrum niveocremeum HHB9708]